jgi:hypothetical protein
MAILTPFPKFRAFTANGLPMAGGKLYTFLTGTSTPQSTYTDQSAMSFNTNPVILDANGEANVWLDSTVRYRFRLDDSTDVTQWTVDGLGDPGASGIPNGMNIAVARATLTASNNAAELTATLLIPAQSLVLALSHQVTTTFGNGNGLSALHIGDGGVVDRWFSNASRLSGSIQTANVPVDSGAGGLSVIVTAVGGTFSTTGQIKVTVYYMTFGI